jgi:hypothetical protein
VMPPYIPRAPFSTPLLQCHAGLDTVPHTIPQSTNTLSQVSHATASRDSHLDMGGGDLVAAIVGTPILDVLYDEVGIATRLWAGRPGLDSRQGQEFFLVSIASRPALEPIQPPMRWVQGCFIPVGKAAGT